MKEQQEFFYNKFIENFVHPAMKILNSTIQPRISEEINRVLHLTN